MDKWNIIIDVERCHNCHDCFLAVKDEYVGNSFPGYSLPQPNHGHEWVRILRRERGNGSLMEVGYLPITCEQCDDAPCMRAAKNGAVYKREDGIVMIDPEKARGQKELVDACPGKHIFWNDELNVPQKWSLDAHLLDTGWKEPRPVTVCATEAFRAVKISDAEMAALAQAEELEVLHPKLKPRVYYKNLYKYAKEFIAGSVAIDMEGVEDVVEGAKVELIREDQLIQTQTTDCFGDFKFDKLAPRSGNYTVRVSADAQTVEQQIDLKLSVNLGVIYLGDGKRKGKK